MCGEHLQKLQERERVDHMEDSPIGRGRRPRKTVSETIKRDRF